MKDREKQLAKNTIIVAFGKICTQFVSFFLLPLYTYLLSTEEYGAVDLLNTYISLILPVVFLQIEQAAFRFLIDVREKEEEKNKLISTVVLTVFVQSIIYMLVYAVIGNFINNEYKYFLATNVIASIFSVLLLQISRGLGDNFTYSLGSVISGAGTIILNIFFIAVLKWGAYGMLTATLISNLLCATFVFVKKKLYKMIKITNFDYSIIKKVWKYSIPLVPNQLSWWIVNASDRTIITYFLGIGANGIYSSANKFSNICITFFNIFNLTWSESASIHIKDEDCSNFFSNIMNTTIRIFTSLCLGIISFMPFVFKILITGETYSSAYYQIPILMISTIFNIIVSLLGSIYVALKKSNEIAKTSIYAAIINIIVNLIFVKKIGLYAASISTLIAYFIMSIYRYINIQKYIKIKLDINMIIISIVIAIIIMCNYYSKNIYFMIINVMISIIFSILCNKNIIILTYKNLKNRFLSQKNK